MFSLKEFIIFLVIVLSVYFLGNFYIYKRSIQALSLTGYQLWIFRIIFLFIILSYIVGRFIEARDNSSMVGYLFNTIGSFWMGMMLYIILMLALIDLLRLFNYFFNFFPDLIEKNKILSGRIAFAGVLSITLVIIIYGFFNARNIKVIEENVFLDKLDKDKNPFTIVQVSDVHLGRTINQKRLFEIANKVNSLNPDIVVFTGDLVDDNSADPNCLVEPLKSITSKYGKYFITGNHDYFGNLNAVLNKVQEAGLKVLRNEYVTIDSTIVLLGLDYLYGRKGNKDTRTIDEILSGANRNLPIVLLKHVPDDLDKIEKSGIDFQLSGHTHHGQLFPFNFITNMVYHVSSGLGKFNNMQIYVSKGVGYWGPPMRVGVESEITKITLKSTKK
ncbi:MAG TPA: metallophosphoesterase [Bacteroidota bacterium]|nr:metallophosphoesterase [Bacteroidota bacterium]